MSVRQNGRELLWAIGFTVEIEANQRGRYLAGIGGVMEGPGCHLKGTSKKCLRSVSGTSRKTAEIYVLFDGKIQGGKAVKNCAAV